MLNGGLFSEINGCISTGKEANVYHAVTAEGTDLAVKIYKTSILVFKDRDRCEDVPAQSSWHVSIKNMPNMFFRLVLIVLLLTTGIFELHVI